MTIYVFGYGSLINRNIKLNKEFDIYTRKIIPVIINNLQRHWIKAINNKTYLGIYNLSNYKTNGLLIEVNESELVRLDVREKFYIRKQIDNNKINIKLNPNDIVYSYYSDKTKVQKTYFNKYSHQNLKYLSICLIGCIQISKDFLINFLSTTHGF